MGELVQFPDRGHVPLLTKRQLANTLQRSTRWVELMVRDHGLPAHWDRAGRERRFDLGEVRQWERERAA